MRATTFRFEGYDDTVYAGFTDDTTWNGWDEVYVTPAVRDSIAIACEDDGTGGATSADLRSLPVRDGLISLTGYCTVTAREVCADCGLTSAARCDWGADRCGDCSLAREERGEQDEVCRAHGAYLPDPEAQHNEEVQPCCGHHLDDHDLRAHDGSCFACERTNGPCSLCDICERVVGDRGFIRVEEGGDIPASIVCLDCLFSPDLDDRRDDLTDDAAIGVGHDCDVFAQRGAHGWTCGACGVLLQQSGDALVFPQD